MVSVSIMVWLSYVLGINDGKDELTKEVISCTDEGLALMLLFDGKPPDDTLVPASEISNIMSLQAKGCLDKKGGREFFRLNFKIETKKP